MSCGDNGPLVERSVEASGGDPAADRWTIAIWFATAELHSCRYSWTEQGRYDRGGRWRRQDIRHWIAGRAANRVRAVVMATHFCTLIRQLARAYAKANGRSAHVRRSFQNACSDGLSARLRAAFVSASDGPEVRVSYAAEAEANDAVFRSAGIEVRTPLRRQDRTRDDRGAARQGKAAAQNISLVLRTGTTTPASPGRKQSQMHFAF